MMEGLTEEEMLEVVEEMDEESLREVLQDEGVSSIPDEVEEMRDRLRILTYCNYQEYSILLEGEVRTSP